jgi:hypothetical protein
VAGAVLLAAVLPALVVPGFVALVSGEVDEVRAGWCAALAEVLPAALGLESLDRTTVAVTTASATSARPAAISAKRRRQYTDGDW